MASSSSAIPHLARAIFEKRKGRILSLWSRTVANGSNISAATITTNVLYVRQYATSPSPFQQRPVSSDSRAFRNHSRPHLPSATSAEPAVAPKLKNNPYGVEPPKDDDDDDDGMSDALKVRRQRYRTATFGFIVVVSGFVAYVYQSYQNDIQRYYAKGNILEQNEDVSSRWRDPRRNFDREVDDAERLMLLKWKRKRLVREAYGDVLEVSVGTGRNMDLYDTRPYSAAEGIRYGRDTRHMITSLTFNDESPIMIENAKKKWADEQKKKRQGDRFIGNVDWYTGDAGHKDVIPRPPGGYDTIVQSWGICSMADPVKFLRHLGRLVRQPGEKVQNISPKRLREQEGEDGKGGRIFLLEHGRGKYEWLNNFLDKSAPMHADRYGCWYNKDIARVIEESGLVVERVRRYNFGTTYEYVLRPSPGPLPGEEITTIANATSEQGETTKTGNKGWLSSFWP